MIRTRSPRRDGWTDERRNIFVTAIYHGASTRAAAAQAGVGVTSLYRLYRRDPQFRAGWEAAQELRFLDTRPEKPARAVRPCLDERALIRLIDRTSRMTGNRASLATTQT